MKCKNCKYRFLHLEGVCNKGLGEESDTCIFYGKKKFTWNVTNTKICIVVPPELWGKEKPWFFEV